MKAYMNGTIQKSKAELQKNLQTQRLQSTRQSHAIHEQHDQINKAVTDGHVHAGEDRKITIT